ncbi:MAG: NAD(P)/FAD-dependent oxidoreductase [Chitinophagaceae bacterium]|nr:NAD(P)/FAD-dependent oxidoreductase [Chitinophagaceae bacterium]MCB9046213.1 NAD(P)/FAD-dependent oxidoreductase [Chitinophagales bacterium]
MRIAIIGAGAAGCFAAANIPYQKEREVVVFEKTNKVLQKVKVSGGGRCNVTHACFDIPELLKRYPRGQRFLRKTLYQFTPQDTIDWFQSRGVKLKTEDDGRMFPVSDDSQTIIDCIWQQMQINKAQVRYGKAVEKIEPLAEGGRLTFKDGSDYVADRVLIACGGFPKLEQFKWITETGHTIQSPVPSLFTFNIPKHPVTELMGVSVPMVTVKIQGSKISETGPILITHWGLSGPVVLRCSAWGARELHERNYDFKILVNWLNDHKEHDVREQISRLRQEQGKQLVHGRNPFGLPKRLWEYMLQQCGIGEETRWGELPAKVQNKMVTILVSNEYYVSGKTTFKEEFVTSGGVTLSEVDAQSVSSKIVRGLYFAGEIMDVDGITGGYNFQHAWSSGYIAAQNMIK